MLYSDKFRWNCKKRPREGRRKKRHGTDNKNFSWTLKTKGENLSRMKKPNLSTREQGTLICQCFFVCSLLQRDRAICPKTRPVFKEQFWIAGWPLCSENWKWKSCSCWMRQEESSCCINSSRRKVSSTDWMTRFAERYTKRNSIPGLFESVIFWKRLKIPNVFQAVMRDLDTTTAVEEANIKNMELQLQRKMFEQVSQLDLICVDFFFSGSQTMWSQTKEPFPFLRMGISTQHASNIKAVSFIRSCVDGA